MSRFPEEVWHLLREAGWHEGRSLNTSPFALANAGAGFAWSAAADGFLNEFGGLMLRFLRHDGSISTLNLNVPAALATPRVRQVQQDFQQRLGPLALTVIGIAYDDDLLLLMDERGRVYGSGCDECLYLVAPNGPAAITAICLDLPFEQL
jgi:SUKH-3 immunity protein